MDPDPLAGQLPEEDLAGPGFQQRYVRRLRLLWAGRRLLVRCAVAGFLAGTLLAFLLPKQYQSTTELMPPDNGSGSSLLMAALSARTSNGLGAVAGDLLGLKNSGQLFVGELRSTTLQDRLVSRFQLKQVYHDRLEVDARNDLADKSAIGEDRKSGIITIAVTDRSPQRAAAIAQAYVEELNRLVAELSTSAAHRERVFLQERLQAVRQDLEQAERDFSQFASRNTAIDIKEQGKAMVEAAASLQGQLIAAQSERKGLEQIYTPGNVRVRAVQARIAELNHQLEKLGGKAASQNPPSDSPASQDALYPSIRELPVLGVPYADLYRRVKIQEAVFEALTQEYELAKVEEAKETPTVKVLDAAEVPEKKSFPPRLQIMALGTVLALAGGGLWLFGHGWWQAVEAGDERKLLAREITHSLNSAMPWAPPNGSRLQAKAHQAWLRCRGRGVTGASRE